MTTADLASRGAATTGLASRRGTGRGGGAGAPLPPPPPNLLSLSAIHSPVPGGSWGGPPAGGGEGADGGRGGGPKPRAGPGLKRRSAAFQTDAPKGASSPRLSAPAPSSPGINPPRPPRAWHSAPRGLGPSGSRPLANHRRRYGFGGIRRHTSQRLVTQVCFSPQNPRPCRRTRGTSPRPCEERPTAGGGGVMRSSARDPVARGPQEWRTATRPRVGRPRRRTSRDRA